MHEGICCGGLWWIVPLICLVMVIWCVFGKGICCGIRGSKQSNGCSGVGENKQRGE